MKKYLVNYCLENESDFEEFHENYDSKNEELFVDFVTLQSLIKRCKTDDDNVDIGIESVNKGKWDYLSIHGNGSSTFDIEYLVGLEGGSFKKNNVDEKYVLSLIEDIKRPYTNFKELGFHFLSW
jgi:hypothetical protein